MYAGTVQIKENTVINPGVKKYIDYSVNQNLEISLKSGIDAVSQKELKKTSI